MSDKNIELPRLRPYARQGRAYVDELKAILKEHKYAILQDERAIFHRTGKVTVSDICRLALKYKLNLKAMFDFLEDERAIPRGTYDKVLRSGIRPMAALKETWAAMQQEQGYVA